jgi:iron-sulfur cluster assembly protein
VFQRVSIFKAGDTYQMITLTPIATDKLQAIMTDKGIDGYALRVFVAGGGCAGLSYGMTFAEGPELGDQVFETGGMKVVVDPASFTYLNGATVDYIDSLMGGGFRIENPNAVQTCACGSSFQTAAGEQGTPCGR